MILTLIAILKGTTTSIPVQKAVAGEVGKNPKTGAKMVFVPAGEFTMGSKESPDQEPVRRVKLKGYWIGMNLVTVQEYKAFCAETNRNFPESTPPAWGWLDKHPMVNVTWDDARSYCLWAGGDLPTEAQWEKAARGTDGRTYPWGKEWDPKKCQCSKTEASDAKSTSAVGSFPKGASPYGCLDMAGNALQWCLDWYVEGGYDKSQLVDPHGPESGKERVMRGGSWINYDSPHFHSAIRFHRNPYWRYIDFGFRMVRRSL